MHPFGCPCAVCVMSQQFDQGYAELGAPKGARQAAKRASSPWDSAYKQSAAASQKAAIKAAKARSKAKRKTQTRAPKTREKVQTRAPKTKGQDSWRSSYQTATAASVAAAQATYNPNRVQTRAPRSRQKTTTGAQPANISKAFGQGRVGKAIALRRGKLTRSGQLSQATFPALSSMKSFEGMGIETTPEGHSHPQLPPQTEQEVPNYYAASRQARGLPQLPSDAGETDHEIAKFLVEKTQSDPDKKQTVEETIYVILVHAAQSAYQANDPQQGKVLQGYAQRWRAAIEKAQQAKTNQGQDQSNQQNAESEGETSGFSLSEWTSKPSNSRWLLAGGLLALAYFWNKVTGKTKNRLSPR